MNVSRVCFARRERDDGAMVANSYATMSWGSVKSRFRFQSAKNQEEYVQIICMVVTKWCSRCRGGKTRRGRSRWHVELLPIGVPTSSSTYLRRHTDNTISMDHGGERGVMAAAVPQHFKDTLSALPTELVEHIASYLYKHDFCSFRLSSYEMAGKSIRVFKDTCFNDIYWNERKEYQLSNIPNAPSLLTRSSFHSKKVTDPDRKLKYPALRT